MPRHIIHIPRYLGENLRRLRVTRGLSTAALGDAIGVSKTYISLIESGKRVPHWSTYMRMVHAMGETLCRFFTLAESLPAPEDGLLMRRENLIIVAGERPEETPDGLLPARSDRPPFTYILTPWHDDLLVETVEIGLAPHTEWTPDDIAFDSRVVAFGISGRLLLEQSGTEYVMRAGESLHYDASVPHRLRNYTDEPTHVVLTIAPVGL